MFIELWSKELWKLRRSQIYRLRHSMGSERFAPLELAVYRRVEGL